MMLSLIRYSRVRLLAIALLASFFRVTMAQIVPLLASFLIKHDLKYLK